MVSATESEQVEQAPPPEQMRLSADQECLGALRDASRLLKRLDVGGERLELVVGDDSAPVRHADDRCLADHAA